jgi:hypothetical protein
MDYNATATASSLGLVTSDYNYLMGFSGLMIGTIICFFVLYSILNIAKGY